MPMNLKNEETLVRIESTLGEVRRDIKAIEVKQGDQNTILQLNTASLDNHMKRTDANEKRILYLERLLMGLVVTAFIGGLLKYILTNSL